MPTENVDVSIEPPPHTLFFKGVVENFWLRPQRGTWAEIFKKGVQNWIGGGDGMIYNFVELAREIAADI